MYKQKKKRQKKTKKSEKGSLSISLTRFFGAPYPPSPLPPPLLPSPSRFLTTFCRYVALEIHSYDPYGYTSHPATVHSWGSDDDRKQMQQWITDISFWASERTFAVAGGLFCRT